MLRSMMMVSLVGLMSLACPAQTIKNASENEPSVQTVESAPKKFYQLNFVVQELENERVINSRSYSVIMRSDMERGSIRVGEKVPFSSTAGGTIQWQQLDVGVNIDFSKLEDMDNRASLNVKAEISSVMDSHAENNSVSSPPVIRSNRWESIVVLPIKQPTILFSSDDPASKRKMQLLLTVTPIR